MEIVALVLLGVVVFLVVSRIAKKRKRADDKSKSESAIDKWAKDEIVLKLAKRLELEEVDLAATLSGSPDPDLVEKLEKAVRKIDVAYERAPGAPGSVDARVEIHFEDGTLDRSIKRFAWSALTSEVANDFAASGASHTFRSWKFPWQD